MSNPEPVPEVVSLYNELITLDPAQQDRIRRIHWKLRLLRSKFPRDVEIAIAYANSLILLGDATEALAISEQIWWQRSGLTSETLYPLAFITTGLGLYARTFELAAHLVDDLRGFTKIQVAAMAEYGAWGIGEIEKFRWAISLLPEPAAAGWQRFLSRLEQNDLLRTLPEHQRIVNDVVFGHQTMISLVLSTEEDAGIELSQYLYVSGDRDFRISLEEQIHDRLDQFYGNLGRAGAPYWDLLTPIILPVSASHCRGVVPVIEQEP